MMAACLSHVTARTSGADPAWGTPYTGVSL